jgi:hypothetical protein
MFVDKYQQILVHGFFVCCSWGRILPSYGVAPPWILLMLGESGGAIALWEDPLPLIASFMFSLQVELKVWEHMSYN